MPLSGNPTVDDFNLPNVDAYFQFRAIAKRWRIPSIDQLKTNVEKWAFFFKYAPETDPADWEKLTQDAVFRQAFQALDQWYWTSEELDIYEREIKNERDAKALLTAAHNDGRQEGKQEGRQEEKVLIARKLLTMNMPHDAICKATGVLPEELEQFISSCTTEK